jgi:hypothetical protein
MSENLIKYFNNDIKTIPGARMEAWKLFLQLKEHHGAKQAHRIFLEWGAGPSKKRINELKNWALLQRYDAMEKPNVAKLAREIVAENAILPKDKQLTPRYRPTLFTVDKHIRLWLGRRDSSLKNCTWEGPTSLRRLHREWEHSEEEFLKPGSSSE